MECKHLSFVIEGQFGGEMSELDDAGTYFDLGPKKITQRGYYYYLCTRNNNFTNRSQKGLIAVLLNRAFTKRIGWNGGTIENGGCGTNVGMFTYHKLFNGCFLWL